MNECMNECNSTEIDKTNLTGQTKYSLNEIAKIENYFIEEINQRNSCRKKLIKYVPAFDYLDKILVVLMEQVVEYPSFLIQALWKHQLE